MSVQHLKQAAERGATEEILRFVHLHLGDGNERIGKAEVDKSWVEATKILLREEVVDREFIASVLEQDDSTLALLYFHLHFALIKKSGEWIHDGSR